MPPPRWLMNKKGNRDHRPVFVKEVVSRTKLALKLRLRDDKIVWVPITNVQMGNQWMRGEKNVVLQIMAYSVKKLMGEPADYAPHPEDMLQPAYRLNQPPAKEGANEHPESPD